jgi:hypothetical protein
MLFTLSTYSTNHLLFGLQPLLSYLLSLSQKRKIQKVEFTLVISQTSLVLDKFIKNIY